MNAVEELLREHLRGIRETIAEANSRANALERLIGTFSRSLPRPGPIVRANMWSAEEDALLREQYPVVGSKGCAALLPHRSVLAIRTRVCRELQIGKIWCGQCDHNVAVQTAIKCPSKFCKAKAELA